MIDGLNDTDAGVRQVCFYALAEYALIDPKIANAMIKELKVENNLNNAYIGAIALAQSNDSRLKDIYTRFLDFPKWEIRYIALCYLSKFDNETLLRKTAERLIDDDPRVRLKAIQILGPKIDKYHWLFSRLMPCLEDENPEILKEAFKILVPCSEKNKSAWKYIERHLNNGDSNNYYNNEIKKTILWGLGDVKNQKSFDTLIRFLDDDYMKKTVILSLGRLGNPKAIEHFSKVISAEGCNVENRKTIAIALDALNAKKSLPLLKKLMDDSNLEVRNTALAAFCRVSPNPKKECYALLEGRYREGRSGAIEFLTVAAKDDKKLFNKLFRLTRIDFTDTKNLEKNIQAGTIALKALAVRNIDIAILFANKEYARSDDPNMRIGGLNVLSLVDSIETENILKSALSDSNEQVKNTAVYLLAKKAMNKKELLLIVSPYWNVDSFLFRETAVAVIKALEYNGQLTDSVILETIIRNSDWEIRQMAVRAIAKSKMPNKYDLLIKCMKNDVSAEVRNTTEQIFLAAGITSDMILKYPQLAELLPYLEQCQQNKGAIVLLCEGLQLWDREQWWDVFPFPGLFTGNRQSGWSKGLLLKETLDLMAKLSGGKIEAREMNWSGNMVNNTDDIESLADELYKVWQDGRQSNRPVYVVQNSFANKMIPKAIKRARKKYHCPELKIERFVSTGNPDYLVGNHLQLMRAVSIQEPMFIASRSDPISYSVMAHAAFDKIFNPFDGDNGYQSMTILGMTGHAGKGGYMDNQESVSMILKTMNLPQNANDLHFNSEQIQSLFDYAVSQSFWLENDRVTHRYDTQLLTEQAQAISSDSGSGQREFVRQLHKQRKDYFIVEPFRFEKLPSCQPNITQIDRLRELNYIRQQRELERSLQQSPRLPDTSLTDRFRDQQFQQQQKDLERSLRQQWQDNSIYQPVKLPDTSFIDHFRDLEYQRQQKELERSLNQQTQNDFRYGPTKLIDNSSNDCFRDCQPSEYQPLPRYEQPRYEQPRYEQPRYEQPAYEQPAYEQPRYEQPRYEPELPVYQPSQYDSPIKYDPPAYQPQYEPPMYQPRMFP